VVRLGRDYIRHSHEHMNLEEDEVFPLLQAVLTRSDWRELALENSLHPASDPVFGRRVQREFRQLARKLRRRLRRGVERGAVTEWVGVEAVLDPASGQDRSEVEGFLAGIARTLRRYDQLRIIDLDGQELARIDDRGGVARVVPADELQNKASRYYVAETLALAPGEIYVSPLDLNIEQGEIEVPYVPMIRFGTLVTDDAGRSAGMVVLNYRGDLILDTIREATQNEAGGALRLLVNDAGYFLLGASPDDEWGWMF
jgi:hypothetical protein